jgi:hypothetical protein
MKYLFRVTIILIGLLALFSCDQFFGANMFGTIDEPDPVAIDSLVAGLDEANAAGGVANLSEAVENDTFFDDLKANIEAAEAANEETNQVTEILDFLETQYTVDVDDETPDEVRKVVQDAAIIAAKVSIETSIAADMVDNVGNMIGELTAGDGDEGDEGDEGDDTSEYIDLLVPETAAPPEGITDLNNLTTEEAEAVEEAKEEFKSLVKSLSSASTAFSAFGSALEKVEITDPVTGETVDEDEDGEPDTEVIVPDDVNIGDTAQSAVVAVLVDTVVDNIATQQSQYLEDNEIEPEELLFELIYFPEAHEDEDVSLWTAVQEEDEDGELVFDTETNEPVMVENPLDAAFSDPGMENILAASGFLDVLEGMFGGGDGEEDNNSGESES